MELGEESSAAAPNLRKDKNKHRRFSDEQIRSLEFMFESQTKLEPRMKMEMARELGLHPRQVAIWFQNRRARWKSKQIEQDYKVLKANYDNLHSQFETLKIEKQSLHIELQDLSNLLEKGRGRVGTTTDLNENRQLRNEPIRCFNQGLDNGRVAYSDGDDRVDGPKFEQREEDIQTMNCQEDGYEELQKKRSNVHSSGLLDESCGNAHWWEYWT